MSHPFTLLATVGSTLFPSLTSHVLLPTFLSLLQSLGVQRLVVQYGRAELKLQDNVKQTLSINPQGYGRGVWSDNDGGGDGDRKQNGMVVEVMRFTNDFEGLVGNSDAVISHAGSGSILTVLRRAPPIPLLVVPNRSLMDDHQSELADALYKDGYVMVASVEDLEEKVRPFLKIWPSQAKLFPGMQKEIFRDIVDDLMGYD
ncbi:UDP-N-acetylglucosamine transferase subunit ALG13 [Cryptococcus neoformans]|nr:UDP-N-acetylglucosamine transferase subunit ALG13 [Cryptococcus neoformans var. grubii]OWZ80053.1 UDP-N-acetylglucosamine transferase subunit ALG13 [Cryptococcus neoformans var. grubii Bt85]OXG21756.1 UDP-N-acetylglucosamine transferase subunit ALG13 [Cryptococcus neoformans var. grubii Tu401-1]